MKHTENKTLGVSYKTCGSKRMTEDLRHLGHMEGTATAVKGAEDILHTLHVTLHFGSDGQQRLTTGWGNSGIGIDRHDMG